jgi:hypothetical protein
MYARTLIVLLCASWTLIGCVEPTEEGPIVIEQECGADCGSRGGKGDEAGTKTGGTELIDGPELLCSMAMGDDTDEFFRTDTLNCVAAAGPDFTLRNVSLRYMGPEDAFGEVAYVTDEKLGALMAEPTAVFNLTGNKYPTTLTVDLGYYVHGIVGPDGELDEYMTEVRTSCEIEVLGPDTTDIECSAGQFERWEIALQPDADLAERWAAGEFRAGSLELTNQFCAADKACDEPQSQRHQYLMRSSKIADLAAIDPYVAVVPKDGDYEVALTPSFPYNADVAPTVIESGGAYVISADGSVAPATSTK